MADDVTKHAYDSHVHDSGTFSDSFPLPLRILALLSCGILAWASNLHLLAVLGIDTAAVLDVKDSNNAAGLLNPLNGASSYAHASRLYPPIYKLALAFFAWTVLGWTAYTLVGHHDDALARFVPAAFALLGVAAVLLPGDKLCKRERTMFLRSLHRTLFDGIFTPVAFCDVILADILTSYAKVLGDVWISVGLLVNTDTRQAWGGHWGVPLLTSLPYILRFRQCVADYMTLPDLPANNAFTSPLSITTCTTPASPRTRALFNALKYASAFPVIALSALQGTSDLFDGSPEELAEAGGWLGSNTIFKLWVLAVLVNSAYSFWWDVTNDWGLALLIPSAWKSPPSFLSAPFSRLSISQSSATSRANKLHSRARSIATTNRSLEDGPEFPPKNLSPPGRNGLITQHRDKLTPTISYHTAGPFLRHHILLPDTAVYYSAIAIDLLLRLTWSLKLSSHLHAIHEIEQGVFLMEGLEVVRRWMWAFIRIEWEAVRKSGAVSTPSIASSTNGPILNGYRDDAIEFDGKAQLGLGIVVDKDDAE